MNRLIILSLGLNLFSIVIGCNSSNTKNEFDAVIKSFAQGTPADQTTAAIELIGSAGVSAFPSLIAHLDDQTVASATHFMRAMVTINKNGNVGPYEPVIGDACFDILQGQIEGPWPKAFRDNYVLNRTNIRDWIAKRKGKTLHQMRLECAKLSLKSAKQKYRDNPSEFLKSCVDFLVENLAEVESTH